MILVSVNLSTSGRYRCEVSAEAPSFQTVSDHGDMVVVGTLNRQQLIWQFKLNLDSFTALPDEGPKITGGKPRYQIGDNVKVNCTSGRSKPSAQLTWYINSDPADSSLLREYDPIITGREGLETTILGLEFRVRPKHFKRGDMKLKVNYGFLSQYSHYSFIPYSNQFPVLGHNCIGVLAEQRGERWRWSATTCACIRDTTDSLT